MISFPLIIALIFITPSNILIRTQTNNAGISIYFKLFFDYFKII